MRAGNAAKEETQNDVSSRRHSTGHWHLLVQRLQTASAVHRRRAFPRMQEHVRPGHVEVGAAPKRSASHERLRDRRRGGVSPRVVLGLHLLSSAPFRGLTNVAGFPRLTPWAYSYSVASIRRSG